MVDFQLRSETIVVIGREDRALLGSNPSARAVDGDTGRGFLRRKASALFTHCVLVRKAINPSLLNRDYRRRAKTPFHAEPRQKA